MTATKTDPSSFTDLESAKKWVQENLRQGVQCPCCGKLAKVYKRKLNATMAYALVRIYMYFKANPSEPWLHVPEFLVRVKGDSTIAGGDVAKLRYWGLLDAKSDLSRDQLPDGAERMGYYRLTDLGKRFVEGNIAVPRCVYLYNQLLLRTSDDLATIREALGSRYNYDKLLNR